MSEQDTRDEAKDLIIDILHAHGATVGAGGEITPWETCEYAAIHESVAKRIVEKLDEERLLYLQCSCWDAL